MIYLLLKKFKRLICYIKKLKDISVTNIKLKRPMDTFCHINMLEVVDPRLLNLKKNIYKE
jgi:hypothetical protein